MIVMNELDALANIDLETMSVKPEHRSLNLVRVGTSGALDERFAPGTVIASQYGLGLDGVLHFYNHHGVDHEDVVKAFVEHTGWGEKLPYPYCVKASDETLASLVRGDEFVLTNARSACLNASTP